ncbi:hypothetical protein SAMN04488498_104326 [Mesorhizobium albiziae]|uniref:Uncharacterized protein n=1 Tax=Neomesorhizobium albiziae TaxID=335020 RepID=A0A1I3YBN7_9HYPH|nr:hypothetical protein [Mesorhizobium albiziae]GLS29969.1 hypothetical protein GCM10007937_16770 [Mesorhizobium albiziae]SFK29150.1 hypothetical protein SAMN04488498_104326 [Mesorhizobium albiziae]
MRISLSPVRRDGTLTVEKSGDCLVIDGVVFDFTPVPDGATLPQDAIDSEWFAGDVERIAGVLHVTLVLPHGPDPSPTVAFPSDIISPPDGTVELPQ